VTVANRKREDGWIDELVGALFDPVIVFPVGGWENDLPDWLFPQIKLERLIMNMKVMKEGGVPVGDTEVLAYMMPRTLESPLNEQWMRIYFHVFNGAMKFKKVEVPEDLKERPLDDYDMQQLNHLRHWIYEQRLKHRKERARSAKLEAKEQATQEKELEIKAAQPSFF